MNKARLVYPGFWFDKTPLKQALELARRGVGGFCLYGGTRKQIEKFVQAVRAASPLPYLLICADYEDGLGRWVPDAPLLPSNLALGAARDENLAFEKGLLTARQARSLGIDWVFAPVVDLADNPLNPIVNTRSFGKDFAHVTSLSGAYLYGLKQGGALTSLKHFPGHGDTTTDSHLALPVLHKSRAQLTANELRPFAALLEKTDSVMMGHLLLPQVDAKRPASLSRVIIGDILRGELNYNGCVLTDALLMKAIGDEKQASLTALHAGVNILLVPENPAALIDFLETQTLSNKILNTSQQLQDALCARAQQTPRPTQQDAFAPNQLNAQTAAKAVVQTGLRSVLQPGETVALLEIGNTAHHSAEPFISELQKNKIRVKPYPAQADKLIVLCFRRYQAFQGKVTLEVQEQTRLQQAITRYPHTVGVLLSSPWALRGVADTQTTLYTFCPAPAFQRQAALILLGQQPARGQLPMDL